MVHCSAGPGGMPDLNTLWGFCVEAAKTSVVMLQTGASRAPNLSLVVMVVVVVVSAVFEEGPRAPGPTARHRTGIPVHPEPGCVLIPIYAKPGVLRKRTVQIQI